MFLYKYPSKYRRSAMRFDMGALSLHPLPNDFVFPCNVTASISSMTLATRLTNVSRRGKN